MSSFRSCTSIALRLHTKGDNFFGKIMDSAKKSSILAVGVLGHAESASELHFCSLSNQ